ICTARNSTGSSLLHRTALRPTKTTAISASPASCCCAAPTGSPPRWNSTRASAKSTKIRSQPCSPASKKLSHRVDVFRRDLEDDALLAGLREGILVFVEVLLGHLVDVLRGAVLSHCVHAATNFQETIWIVGIDDGDRNARIAFHVLVLQPADRRIDP